MAAGWSRRCSSSGRTRPCIRSKDGGRNRSAWHDGREAHLVSADLAGPPETPEPPAVAAQPAANTTSAPAESVSEPSPDDALAIADWWQFIDVRGRDSLLAPLDAAILKWRCGGKPFTLLLVRLNDLPSRIASHGTKVVRRAIKRALGLARASFGEFHVIDQLDDATAVVILPATALLQVGPSADLLRQTLLQTATTSLPSLTLSLSAAEVCWGDTAGSLLDRAEEAMKGATTFDGIGLSLQTAAVGLPTAVEG